VSGVFQGLLDTNGRINVGVGPVVSYFRGLPLNASGQVVVGAGPITRFDQGIPFNDAGEVVGLQTTEPSRYGPGATPYGPNGELCAEPSGTIARYYQGVPYNAGGVYCGSGTLEEPIIISKDFTLTPAQVSSTTIGYRLSPLSGAITPDNAFGGGSIANILAINDDVFQIAPVGGAPFPDTSGNLAFQIGPYVGPNRIILTWDGFDRYVATVPGIYVLFQEYLGAAQGIRLSAAPEGGVTPAWSPLLLFLGGEQGAWYDPSDLSTLFQDASGTTPVTAIGQPVARMLDLSGNDNHALPTNATLRQTADGLYYLQYTAGGDIGVTFGSALGAASSVFVTTPDRQGYQVRTGVTVGTTFALGDSHGPVVLIDRALTQAEIVAADDWADLVLYGVTRMAWTRNPSWAALPTVSDTDQRFAGLFAVYPEVGNFVALSAAGNYTVDWGDGVTENVNTGVTAYHQYDYTDADLANTNAPVTLTDAGDLVQRTAHGYSNGDVVRLWNIVSTTGVSEGQQYYVINATANAFQISETLYGTPVTLTTNGTATLLRHKQAIISVTPQAGQNLTALNINLKHNQTGLQLYDAKWLDIVVGSPNFTTTGLVLGASTLNVNKTELEQVTIVNPGANNTCAYMFYACYSLASVPLFNTAAVTNMANMFQNCYSLVSVPLFNTAAVTNMTSMFNGCYSLASVPLFNTAAVTNMASMFSGCTSLASVPLFNTAAVTNMASMFQNCYSLVSVPLFNTAAVTSMASMFQSCYSLASVPLFNTAAVTNMASMFQSCYSLASVPLLNTAAVTNMTSMFNGCYSLASVPLFNTAAVTNMASMFSGCTSLASVPLLNTAAVTNMTSMFNACYSLASVPLFNTAAVTSMASMFSGCRALTFVPAINVGAVNSAANFATMFANCSNLARISATGFAYTFSVENCSLGAAALDELYGNLATTTGQTVTVTGNWGVTADTPSIATGKGWTVTG
jgi:surface protein